ncbi:MAG TPA: 3-carboxy-cis,cis-muconate cycloisomerase [Xanthobacteraceae bacterium]|nr:3-carboxy-cis,cis-muconate cycloisomerase [Xanthobacteraceae bacterium]
MGLSPFDHPLLSGLLGDVEVGGELSASADIVAILAFESALARAEAAHGIIPATAAERIGEGCAGFAPDFDALRSAVAIDGVVVPDLVRQLRAAVGGADAAYVHFGATSQDAVDTSLMLRLKRTAVLFDARLAALISRLDALDGRFGAAAMMGQTRMQPAIAITAGDRLRAWRDPLAAARGRLAALVFPLQFGGAAGTLEKFDGKGAAVRATLAGELGLTDTRQWHSGRAPILDIGHALALISGSLGKIGQDIALMAQNGEEIALSGGGGSSAMPHKQNPVAAEALVTLARFNATLAGGLHQSMVHEQERSGAAWTLEWMILPQMALACGSGLQLAGKLLASVRRLGNLPL